MFVPFITILPGMIAAVLVTEIADLKAGGHRRRRPGRGSTYNDALLYLMRDLLPNGLLGLAITGLLAAFMAGMAANISAFNTVFSYDLWQDYVVKGREDGYYLRIGRIATVGATVDRDRDRDLRGELLRTSWHYLQTLFGFFNAPLFATFILGMFWKRMTADRRLGRAWSSGTLSAVAVAFLSEDAFGSLEHGRDPDRRPGRRVPRRVGGLRRRRPAQRRGLRGHRAEAGRAAARAGLLRDAQGGAHRPATRRRTRGTAAPSPWPASSLAMVIVLNMVF